MQNRYEFILGLVKEAGWKLKEYTGQKVETDTKNNNPLDLVTKVDVEISEFLTSRVREGFPGEVVYSEEAADVDISSGSYWSIDPIDGTTNFSRGIPHYSVVIAYVEKGVPAVGALYNPVTDELYSFEKGKGAYLNGKQIHVSNVTALDESYMLLRAGRNKDLWDWGTTSYKFMLEHGVKCANLGSSGLDMCYVAAGRVEANIYGTLTTIDIAAALGLVWEAGGMIVGKGGQEVSEISKEKQQIIGVNNRTTLQALEPIFR
ncbi:inositol monophosphatase [Candidatus Parcubacteria bacterium]|nr:inositol monophosphatase [Candidatus Parcubacteria bacterium]